MRDAVFTNAVAAMDRYYPDWWRRIDLDSLNLDSLNHCILGQLNDGFPKGGWLKETERILSIQGTQAYYLWQDAAEPFADDTRYRDMWIEEINKRRQEST